MALFFGIGAGSRRRRARLLAGTASGARMETDDEMRGRHARERRAAGFDEPPEGNAPPEERDARAGDDGDDDADAKTGDRMPPDNDPDPDADPPEQHSDQADGDGDDDEPDEDDEDREDSDIDGEPDEEVRRARRAALRRRRRAAARRAERARCARIFQAPAAARNTGLAAELAFNTRLSSRRAVAILMRGGAAGGLGARMAVHGALPSVAIGSGAGMPAGGSSAAIAASWDATMKRVRSW